MPHSCITSATTISAAGTISRSFGKAAFLSVKFALGTNTLSLSLRPLPRKKRESRISTASAHSTLMNIEAAKFFTAPAPRKYIARPASSTATPASAITGRAERQARRSAAAGA